MDVVVDSLNVPGSAVYENPPSDGKNPFGSMLSYEDKNANDIPLEARDSEGCTVLHLAVKSGNLQVLKEHKESDLTLANSKGETILHIATTGRVTCLEKVLSVLEERRQLEQVVDMKDIDGNAAYHTAVSVDVSVGAFKLILTSGADLELQNKYGDTVLHALVAATVVNPDDIDTFLEKYKVVVDYCVMWWVKKEGIIMPRNQFSSYRDFKRYSFLRLTTSIKNREDLNVIEFAIQLGAVEMLNAIFQTKDVYCFEDSCGIYNTKTTSYDVTYLTPETVPVEERQQPRTQNKAQLGHDLANTSSPGRDGTDIIACMDNYEVAVEVLDITPFRELVENYWRPYRVVFCLIAIPHIIYMLSYSVLHLVTIQGYHNSTEFFNCTSYSPVQRAYTYCGVLTWPLCMLAFELYYIISDRLFSRKFRSRNRVIRDYTMLEPKSRLKLNFDNIGSFLLEIGYYVFDNLPHIAAFLLVMFVFVDYFGYVYCWTYRLPFVILTIIYGWIYATSFPRGFEGLHTFNVLYKFILVQDLPKLFSLLIFVLCAYVFAFYTLLLLSGINLSSCDAIYDCFFYAFNLMFDHNYSWGDEVEVQLKPYGIDSFFLKTLFLSYILITAIVFLNILIAMMTDTYTRTQENSEKQWKINSLVRSIKREKKMPILRKLLQRFKYPSRKVNFVEFKVKGVKTDGTKVAYAPMIRSVLITNATK